VNFTRLRSRGLCVCDIDHDDNCRAPGSPPSGAYISEEWHVHWPDYHNAYHIIVDAGGHATQPIPPVGRQMTMLCSPELLDTFFSSSTTGVVFSPRHLAHHSRQIGSNDAYNVIFRFGEWHRYYLLRLCELNAFLCHLESQFLYSPDTYRGVFPALHLKPFKKEHDLALLDHCFLSTSLVSKIPGPTTPSCLAGSDK
jgi:hypothetical protein